ncbi:hypothetical protein TcCL_ESM10646 [Trypanosoma cruzi]|nr:hypothetical protein TcCL_ESM10646 [Trypanosoma cruzi]
MVAGVVFPAVLPLHSFACDGPNVFTGVWWGRVLVWKKAFRRHNETAVRATRGSREFPGIYWRGGTAPMRCGSFVFRNARSWGCAVTTYSSGAARAARGAKRRSGGCVLPSDM